MAVFPGSILRIQDGCDINEMCIEALYEVTFFSDLRANLFQQDSEPSSFPDVALVFAGLAARYTAVKERPVG